MKTFSLQEITTTCNSLLAQLKTQGLPQPQHDILALGFLNLQGKLLLQDVEEQNLRPTLITGVPDSPLYYILDRIEHAGSVSGRIVLAHLPLEEALDRTPWDYEVTWKQWGFWPVISKDDNVNDYLYHWDATENRWIKNETLHTPPPVSR